MTVPETRGRALRQSSTPHPGYVPPLALLLVRAGGPAGHRLTVRSSAVTIGSGKQADLMLAAPTVAGLHARLELRQGVWFLTPLDPAAAARVDGEPVTGEAPLSPGSTIHLGEVALLFEPRDSGEMDQNRRPEGAAAGRTPAPPRAGKGGRFGFVLLVILGMLLFLGGIGLELSR